MKASRNVPTALTTCSDRTGSTWAALSPSSPTPARSAQLRRPGRLRDLFALACISLVGCTGATGGPETVDATGVVTIEGQPVAGATVFFEPADRSSGLKTSVGETDEQGRFSMETHVAGADYKQGVVPGDYVVAIEKLEGADRQSMLTPPKDLLPLRYKNPATSKLTAAAAADTANEYEFNLEK